MTPESFGDRLTKEGRQSLCDSLGRGLEETGAVLRQLDDPCPRGHVAHLSLVSDNFAADAEHEQGHGERRESGAQLIRLLCGRGRRGQSAVAQSVREHGSRDLGRRIPPAVGYCATPLLEQMAAIRGCGKRLWPHGVCGFWNWRGNQHQTPHLCRASRRQLRGNQSAVPMAEKIDLAQAHRIQKIGEGSRMLGYTGRCGR